jgi:hypothetical protein
MQVKHVIFPRLIPWVTKPNLTNLEPVTKPDSPIFSERAPLKMEYTEEELRRILLEHPNHWAGATFSEQSLSTLPDNYLLNIYLNTRYQVPMPDGMMPMRASTEVRESTDLPPDTKPKIEFSACQHLLPTYVLAACLFGALFDRTKQTISPEVHFSAMQLLRIAHTLYFMAYTLLLENPNVEFNDRLVIGQLNEYNLVGNNLGHSITIYMDAAVLESYVAAGGTIEQIIDHWLMHKTQPPAP